MLAVWSWLRRTSGGEPTTTAHHPRFTRRPTAHGSGNSRRIAKRFCAATYVLAAQQVRMLLRDFALRQGPGSRCDAPALRRGPGPRSRAAVQGRDATLSLPTARFGARANDGARHPGPRLVLQKVRDIDVVI